MDEPPIYSSGLPKLPNGVANSGADVNPFAPVIDVPSSESGQSRVELPVQFWGILALALLGFSVVTSIQPGLGICGLLALITATCRVPLLQLRISKRNPGQDLPNSTLLLVTSWVYSLAIGAASFVAFCVICIPSGFAAFSLGNAENVTLPIAFGFSGIVGLCVFVFLFRLTLRFPV